MPEIRDNLIKEISTNLSENTYYSTKMKVFTAKGEEKWYLLELEKRTLDNTGEDKILAYMTNIEKQVEIEEENSVMSRCLKSIQELSNDIVFHVDVTTRTLYHNLPSYLGEKVGNSVEGLVKAFKEDKIIHPDEFDSYIKYVTDWYKNDTDINIEYKIKMNLNDKGYETHLIRGKKIFDIDGMITNTIGVMVNIENELLLKEDNELKNKTFDALGEITDCVLYYVDPSTLTMYNSMKSEVGQMLGNVVPNYRQVFKEKQIIHPDDIDRYIEFVETWYASKSIMDECVVRASVVNIGEYKTYCIRSKKVYDSKGVLTDVVGAMVCIENETQFKNQLDKTRQIFNAVQELTDNVMYHIDVERKILNHNSQTPIGKMLGESIPNYMTVFNEKQIIHRNDFDRFADYFKRWYAGEINEPEIIVKASLINLNEYKTYALRSKKIFDEDGNLTDVIGAMVSIEEQEQIKSEFKKTEMLFTAMQNLTEDILFQIDVKTKTLYHSLSTGNIGLQFSDVIPNFLETLIIEEMLHRDDVEKLKQWIKDWKNDDEEHTIVRFALYKKGNYTWYQIKAIKIYDNLGNLIESYGKLINVDKQKNAEIENSITEQYMLAMQETTDTILYRVDFKNQLIHFSKQIENIHGIEKVVKNNEDIFLQKNMIHKDDIPTYLESYKFYETDDKVLVAKLRISINTPEFLWYELTVRKIYDNDGNTIEAFATLVNIDKQIAIAKENHTLNSYFSALQHISNDIIFHIYVDTKDFVYNIIDENGKQVPRIIPDFAETFIKQGFIRPDDADNYRNYVERLLAGYDCDYEVQCLVKDDIYEWFRIRTKVIVDDNNKPKEIFGKMINIQKEKTLLMRATHDQMTEVLNRVAFIEEANIIIENSKDSNKHAIIFIDLDDFKGVNDTLGHAFGDELLITVAKRLKSVVREYDLVGRLGGDEFVVFLTNIQDSVTAVDRANLLLVTLQKDFIFHNNKVLIKASLGVAIYPEHGKTCNELLEKSDLALYQSKGKGKNVVSLYIEDINN